VTIHCSAASTIKWRARDNGGAMLLIVAWARANVGGDGFSVCGCYVVVDLIMLLTKATATEERPPRRLSRLMKSHMRCRRAKVVDVEASSVPLHLCCS